MGDQIEEMMLIGKRWKQKNKERKKGQMGYEEKRWKEKEEEKGKEMKGKERWRGQNIL